MAVPREEEGAGTVTVRDYTPEDRPFLVRSMEEMQDHLTALDPLGRLRRLPEYAESYVGRLLREVEERSGVILVAEADGAPAGLAVGVVDVQEEHDRLECVETRPGLVAELYVAEPHRRRGVAARLMAELERRLRERGCDYLWLEVFWPNDGARALYRKLGFHDRQLGMGKPL